MTKMFVTWTEEETGLIIQSSMAVRCQQDLLFLSQTCRVFESYLSCSESDLPIFWVSPSYFCNQLFPLVQVSPSHFSSQTSHFFESFLSTFPSQSLSFFDSHLHIFTGQSLQFSKSALLIFRARPSHFFGSVLLIFESDLFPIFFTASFQILSVLCCDLIAMCTVYKIEDVDVYRKRLHCTVNILARETNQQNNNRQSRKREQ